MSDIERRKYETGLYIAHVAADISPYITFTEGDEGVTVMVSVKGLRDTGSDLYEVWQLAYGQSFTLIHLKDGEWRFSDCEDWEETVIGSDDELAKRLNRELAEAIDDITIGGTGERAQALFAAFMLVWEPRRALGRRYHVRFTA